MTTDTKMRTLRRANYLVHIQEQAYEGGPWASTTFAVSNIQELPTKGIKKHPVWHQIIPEAMQQALVAKKVIQYADSYRDFFVVPPEVEVSEEDFAQNQQQYHTLGLLSTVTGNVRGRDEAEGNPEVLSGTDTEADSGFGVEQPVEETCHIDT